MASPFPGMDPYLEDQEIWSGFHSLLAGELLRRLNPLIVPKYYADLEVHAVLQEVGITTRHNIYPDAAVLELAPQRTFHGVAVASPEAPVKRVVELASPTKLRTVQVYVTETQELVTSIEILSPYNKSGEGLRQFRQKRSRLLRSSVHLVELDLLRGGERPGYELHEPPLDTDYIILVNRATGGTQRLSEVWPVALNESLPVIPIPLTTPDPDVLLDLNQLVQSVYADAYYVLRIDYSAPPPPPKLRSVMQQWRAAQ
ncbi:MAG: DUF4058 family protein [Caldilinea sp. CFX5]|nr:DUF4058 family protein [Caldilinea sp. CFX5]